MSFYLMHRGWMDHYIFKDKPYSEREAWEYIISHANFSPSKFRQSDRVFSIPRGDLACSYRSLANKWKWSTNKVIRFLKLIKNESMIFLKTEHGFLQISVCNYDSYQSTTEEKETDTEHGRNTDGTRTDTDTDTNQKKVKTTKQSKKNNRGEINPPQEFQDLISIWNEILGDFCPKIIRLTEQRKRLLANRMNDSFEESQERWREYCQAIRGSPFCMGNNDRGWRANIDWALKPQTVAKVLEGFFATQEIIFKAPSKTDLAIAEVMKRYAEPNTNTASN